MISQWWSWGIFAWGVTCLYFITKDRPWAWLLSFIGQSIWIVYGIATRQWGFIASGVAYGTMQFLGWRRSHAREKVRRDEDLRIPS